MKYLVSQSLRMAPESAKDKIYSTKSDVFSYGVVLYEICTQSTPWAGLSGGKELG